MGKALSHVLFSVLGTTAKLGVCAMAPLASTKMFVNPGSNGYGEVIRESSLITSPQAIAFAECATHVIAKDIISLIDWFSKDAEAQTLVSNAIEAMVNKVSDTTQTNFMSEAQVANNHEVLPLVDHNTQLHADHH